MNEGNSFLTRGSDLNNEKFSHNRIGRGLVLLPVVACIIYAAYLIQAIYVERALYADGANFFVELLSKDRIWPIADDSKHIRLFVNVLNQIPVVFALKLGVDNLRVLKILFGAGLFLTPLIFYSYCFFLSRRANDYRVFFFSIVSLITCAIPSDIFIVNQAFTSLALAWILVHYLLLDLKIRWIDWAAFVVVSLLLFRAHESLILWGGIFFFGSICIFFLRDRGNINNKNLIVYAIGGIGLLQSAFVAFWQYSHPVGKQTSAFLQLISLLKPSELWVGNTRISLLMAAAVLLAFIAQDGFNRVVSGWKVVRILAYIGLIFVLGIMLLSGFSALSDFSVTNPVREYNYRILITFGAAGWMFLAMAFVLAKRPLGNSVRPLSKVLLSLGIISASLWQISNSIQWSIFANAASQVQRSASVSIIDPIEVKIMLASVGREDIYKYRWVWAWPVFGMSLQESGDVERLFKPESDEAYFNPPKHIPFIPMSGGEIGSEGSGLFSFDHFVKMREGNK